MKTFDIITEADARVLQRGETVTLSGRGHITPLALDTLRERRITVVREGSASAEDLNLAPPAEIKKVAIASDHTGVTIAAPGRESCSTAECTAARALPCRATRRQSRALHRP